MIRDYIAAPNLGLRDTFLRLAFYNTPYGTEAWCYHMIPGFQHVDDEGNVHVLVRRKDGSLPNTMFSCHLDNACRDFEKVRFVFSTNEFGDDYVATDGSTILGADCKIGAAIMIRMIWHEVPGYYVFHVGEERGGIGSSWLSRNPNNMLYCPSRLNKCIAFDRYGFSSVITHQGARTCSDVFAHALSAELNKTEGFNYTLDENGLYTDSEEYAHMIPECTNISVGYDDHHTSKEWQNLSFAEALLDRCIRLKWEELPCPRNPETDNDYGGMSGYYGRLGNYAGVSWSPDPPVDDPAPFVGGSHRGVLITKNYSPTLGENATCIRCVCGADHLVPESYLDGQSILLCECCGETLDPENETHCRESYHDIDGKDAT